MKTEPTSAEADSRDLLHPGDAGYKLTAGSVNLSIFKCPERQ
jgi:hypothetical protein